jgi:hypothetical protein
LVFARSIRFAPPLVIEESDLRKGISIIEESLRELDEVSIPFSTSVRSLTWPVAFQLDRIPGDEGEEKGTVIGLED